MQSDKFKQEVAKALPKHVSADRFLRVGITCLTKTPKLAECTTESFLQAMLSLSQVGLEPDGRRAHLIPYGKTCTLVIDYKGYVELVLRSGMASFIHADVVCENDDFEENKGEVVKHKIDRKKPRGAMYAAYAICRFKDGTEKAEIMSRDDIELIRKRSKAGNSGPWQTDYNEMSKKTVFRRLSKWLPMSAEIQRAIEADDEQFKHDDSITPAAAPSGESRTDELANLLSASIEREPGDDAEPPQLSPPDDFVMSDLALEFESKLHDSSLDRLGNATLKQSIGASKELVELEKLHLMNVVRENEERLKKK